MRLIFMGTPAFSVPIFHALRNAGQEIVAVFSQPPRPAGRGKKIQRTPVHDAADAAGITVFTPSRLKEAADVFDRFRGYDADAAIVVAYGNILPEAYLNAPRLGCLNVHASLLPRWRGAAPIQAALCAGDARTGVSIMQMDRGLDTGPVLAMSELTIAPTEDAATLHDRLSELGATLLVETLRSPLRPVAQPIEGAIYAPKISKEAGFIDWTLPATDLERRIRAFHPWPSCTTIHQGIALKIGAAQVTAGKAGAAPGEVIDNCLTVQCGRDALCLTRLQRPGKAMIDRETFLRGMALREGTRFE